MFFTLLFLLTSLHARELTTFEYGANAYKVEELAKTDEIVWGMEFVGPGHILFTKKNGKLALFELATKKADGIQWSACSQQRGAGGLTRHRPRSWLL